jgi:hypothetical protein
VKVLTEQPVRFLPGEVLAPEDLNRVYRYAQDAVADVAQRRWAKSLLTFPFRRDVATPYTQSLSTEERTYRFTCPVECVVEGASLSANLTASGPARWNITTAAGATPTGCTVPYLSTDDSVASSSVDISDVNVDKFVLAANTEYKLTLSGTTFSAERADVALRLAIDRWKTGGTLDVPSFSPTLHAANGSPNAVTVNANTASLTTQAAKFAARASMTPALFVAPSNLSSATAATLRTWNVPLWEATRARARAVRLYVYALGGASASSVTAQLQDASSTVLASATTSVSANSAASASSGAISVPLTGTGVTETPASDYKVVLSGGAASLTKAYALLWIEWS